MLGVQNESKKYVQVVDKVHKIKKFYWLAVVSGIASFSMVGFSFYLGLSNAPYSDVPIVIFSVTPFVFGIVLLSEYQKIFSRNPFFSKRWEERQIQKYIDKDRDNANKYM